MVTPNDTRTRGRRELLAEICGEYEHVATYAWADAITPGEQWLLIEENTRGGFWLSTWSDPESAADYHANQEYASEWTATELLVDLDTGAEYRPGPASFTWEPTAEKAPRP